jgi:hypothetical protein
MPPDVKNAAEDRFLTAIGRERLGWLSRRFRFHTPRSRKSTISVRRWIAFKLARAASTHDNRHWTIRLNFVADMILSGELPTRRKALFFPISFKLGLPSRADSAERKTCCTITAAKSVCQNAIGVCCALEYSLWTLSISTLAASISATFTGDWTNGPHTTCRGRTVVVIA